MGSIKSLHKAERERYVCPNAAMSAESRGRARPLEPDGIRTEYQRDIHRIIYSQPFRRLRHKTQVFYMPDDDHICTRMEHSLHVASAARTVARALGLNEDLAEAIGLAHDLGHTPFGHHGEVILGDICKENGILEPFHHEVHSLRVVDVLAELDREEEAGLNLTWEVRDGIVSHCGEDLKQGTLEPGPKDKRLRRIRVKTDAGNAATLEGCIVRLVDKIAYAGRDLEDGIRAEIICDQDIPANLLKMLGRNNGEITGRLLKDLINDSSTSERCICLSPDMKQALLSLIQFNYKKIYNCSRAQAYRRQADYALKRVFEILAEALLLNERFHGPLRLECTNGAPRSKVYEVFSEFVRKVNYSDETPDARITIDFLAGFTDNYVLRVAEDLLVPQSSV